LFVIAGVTRIATTSSCFSALPLPSHLPQSGSGLNEYGRGRKTTKVTIAGAQSRFQWVA
jgi:hypothetical protein